MRTTLIVLGRAALRWLALGAWLVGSTTAFAQPRYGLSADAYAIFSKWLATTCIGDEERELRAALLRHRAELAPAFRQAIADGPAAGELQAVRRAAQVRQAALARAPLSGYRIEGVTPEAVARFDRGLRADHADDQVQRYAAGYRSSAMAGLAITGGAQDRARLARYASRGADPAAPAAREALRTMGRD